MNWDYASIEYALSAALLTCAMFGMGATLRVSDFLGVLKSPRGLLLIISMQVIAMPLVAIALAKVFNLSPGVAVGMVLISALPGGLFSNLVTYMGKGNVALSVSATAFCTVLSLLTTVFVLKTFAKTELPGEFSMPAGRILGEVFFCLLLPLVLGMIFYRMAPRAAPRVSQICVRVSLVLLLLIVIAAMLAGRLNIWSYGWKAPLALVLFGMIGLWLSYGMGAMIRLTIDDSFTVAIEVVIRNAHLGILLKAALFPASDQRHVELADGVLYALLMYSLICLTIAGLEVVAKHRGLGPIFSK